MTIVKDNEHRSKGIAFALFIEREPCIRIINTFHGKQVHTEDNNLTLYLSSCFYIRILEAQYV